MNFLQRLFYPKEEIRKLKELYQNKETIMAAIDDLRTAVDNLLEESSSIRSLITDLYAKIGPLTLSQAQLDALNPELGRLAVLLNEETQRLNDALFPPEPTEPPTP